MRRVAGSRVAWVGAVVGLAVVGGTAGCSGGPSAEERSEMHLDAPAAPAGMDNASQAQKMGLSAEEARNMAGSTEATR